MDAIADISDDSPLISERLSPFKVWCDSDDPMKVIAVARTKRRARELLGETSPVFDDHWREIDGDESHELAVKGEEGLWPEKCLKRKPTDGTYYRNLTQADALQILEEHLWEYERKTFAGEMPVVGTRRIFEETNSKGTTYKVCTAVIEPEGRPGAIQVVMELDDGLNWPCFYVQKYEISAAEMAAHAKVFGA